MAPFTLQSTMVTLIERVADAARAGRPARIVCKFNALTDPVLIAALIAASQAGAEIDLIVRGACSLPPGLPGRTDHIRVRSVVGRFLEHTRGCISAGAPRHRTRPCTSASADWMTRNMLRRIEVAWPIRDATLRQRVIDECLVPYLHDERDAWTLDSTGRY